VVFPAPHRPRAPRLALHALIYLGENVDLASDPAAHVPPGCSRARLLAAVEAARTRDDTTYHLGDRVQHHDPRVPPFEEWLRRLPE
jgi:hypothetical protein